MRPDMDKAAFLQALASPSPAAEDDMAMQGGDQMAMGLLEEMNEDIDPTTQDGDVFFLDPDMWPEGKWKKGQTITVKARVESIGSKIGLTPVEVDYNMADENDQDSEEDSDDDE